MEEARQHYIEQNGIVFELRAYNNDGDTLISYTGDSFDDVSGFAFLADENFDRLVMEDEESKEDALVDAEINNELDRGY